MTATTTAPAPATPVPDVAAVPAGLRGRWPLLAFPTGVAAFVASGLGAEYLEEDVTSRGPLAVYEAMEGNGTMYHLGMDLAFLAALGLALFGVGFVRFLEARAPRDSMAVPVARLGLVAAVATSVLVAVFKAVFRGGLPDHVDHSMYSRESVGVMYSFVDQLSYTGLWPMVLTIGAVAVLGLGHRVLPRWYGGFSALLAVATLVFALVLGLPYFIGLVGPVWLVVSGVVVLRHRARTA